MADTEIFVADPEIFAGGVGMAAVDEDDDVDHVHDADLAGVEEFFDGHFDVELFADFADEAGFEGFSFFELAAGQVPLLAFAFQEDNFAVEQSYAF